MHAVCPLVTNAVDWIAKNALHVEGIFRISPKSQELEKLKESMDSSTLCLFNFLQWCPENRAVMLVVTSRFIIEQYFVVSFSVLAAS